MEVHIHELDRYNFNRGMNDVATGASDEINGRFAELGWAKSFITRGYVARKIKWKRGEISSSTTVETAPHRSLGGDRPRGR